MLKKQYWCSVDRGQDSTKLCGHDLHAIVRFFKYYRNGLSDTLRPIPNTPCAAQASSVQVGNFRTEHRRRFRFFFFLSDSLVCIGVDPSVFVQAYFRS